MKIKRFVCLMFAIPLFMLCGCATIPTHIPELNNSVSVGLERLRDDHLSTIKQLASAMRKEVDGSWDDKIYGEVLKKYRKKYDINLDERLTDSQSLEVATIAAGVRELLLNEINDFEETCTARIMENYARVISVNDDITKYLRGLVNIKEAESDLMKIVKKSIGIEAFQESSVIKESEKFRSRIDSIGSIIDSFQK